LFKYVGLVLSGLALMMTVVYGIVLKLAARRNPVDFMKRSRLVIITAFSTSSSNATLPTTIEVAQSELGIRKAVAGFVLPLGATMNMNGTSLFEGVTVLFLAQVFGIELSLGQQILVIAMSVITAIGAAGIPGGSIPFLIVVLGMFGIPPEGIAIVLGIDRILDMCRTIVNVAGDLVTASIVERMESRAA
jgi:DAACS family dicarboxylate/amino acid:cation (Na+ or H+) symporter